MEKTIASQKTEEKCLICEGKKSNGIHICGQFICEGCEQRLVHTNADHEFYSYYLMKLRKLKINTYKK